MADNAARVRYCVCCTPYRPLSECPNRPAASDAYIGVSEETYAQLVKIAQSLDCTINAAAEEVLREFFERKEMEPWA